MAEKQSAWLDAVRVIVQAVRDNGAVTELELSHGDFRVRLKREPGLLTLVASAEGAAPAAAGTDTAAHLHTVASPLTGVFYAGPSPAAKPYVNVGDWVDAETVVGLVETMKVFNEVTADRSGRVVQLLVQSGQLVHAGEPILLLEPGERSEAAPEEAV